MKKTDLDIQREAWHRELSDSVTFANGVRVNETLIGRVQRIREIIPEKSKSVIRVQSSTERPIDFGTDLFAWLKAVRGEARKLSEKNFTPIKLKIAS